MPRPLAQRAGMRPVFGDALMVHLTVHSRQVPEFSLATTDLNGTPASPRESFCALRSDDTDARKEALRRFGRSDRRRLPNNLAQVGRAR